MKFLALVVALLAVLASANARQLKQSTGQDIANSAVATAQNIVNEALDFAANVSSWAGAGPAAELGIDIARNASTSGTDTAQQYITQYGK